MKSLNLSLLEFHWVVWGLNLSAGRLMSEVKACPKGSEMYRFRMSEYEFVVKLIESIGGQYEAVKPSFSFKAPERSEVRQASSPD